MPTLVMFAHPKCPCTRASIGELAELATRCVGRVDICVLFFAPSLEEKSWRRTDLWQSAADIPDARVMVDIAGKKSERFGAQTSGHVLLYDRHGRIVFSGGITEGRGHSGDNIGKSSIESFLLNGAIPTRKTEVYGCSLVDCTDGKELATW
jgi:hypothetical protein